MSKKHNRSEVIARTISMVEARAFRKQGVEAVFLHGKAYVHRQRMVSREMHTKPCSRCPVTGMVCLEDFGSLGCSSELIGYFKWKDDVRSRR
jgi:hypothetical protein